MQQPIYLEKTDIHSTLTTWIYCAFWQMWAAEQMGNEVYINWPYNKSLISYQDLNKFSETPIMYEWYFVQPKVSTPPPREEVWDWENCPEAGVYCFMGQPLSVIKEYYKKHLHFNDATNQRGQAIVDKYNIDFSKTIGITWRGTDVYLDGRPRIAIETYFPFIDEILEKEPDLRLMCTSEEEKILDPLFARYSNAFLIEEFQMSPFECKDNPERFSPMSGYERGLQPTLMVWLFGKCAHYIKNRSSTGGVASWISSGRIVSIAHPENLGFPANTHTAEIEGKLYPINY
jgi:hypothetical protein